MGGGASSAKPKKGKGADPFAAATADFVDAGKGVLDAGQDAAKQAAADAAAPALATAHNTKKQATTAATNAVSAAGAQAAAVGATAQATQKHATTAATSAVSAAGAQAAAVGAQATAARDTATAAAAGVAPAAAQTKAAAQKTAEAHLGALPPLKPVHSVNALATEGADAVADAAGDAAQAAAENVWDAGGSALHSAIRWEKVDAVNTTLEQHKDLMTCQDPRNGNFPMHIAAQNGHLDIVTNLIASGADVNVQNKAGQTPLHMAWAYGYHFCCEALKEAGADEDIENNAGHPARTGIDGTTGPLTALDALVDSRTEQHIQTSMEWLNRTEPSTLDKATAVQAMMNMNKVHGTDGLWPEARKEELKAFIQRIE